MPLVLDRGERSVSRQSGAQRRISGIPRPLKHLSLETNSGGISHASKPTIEILPNALVSKREIRKINIDEDMSKGFSLKHIESETRYTPMKIQSTFCQPLKSFTQMDNDPEVAILELVPFSQQPTVDFGKVALDSTRIKYVTLRNASDRQQQLKVVLFPKAEKGFYIDATEFLIAPRAQIGVCLAWTPKVAGGVRETITLQDINRMRWRIALAGTGVAPKPSLPFQNRGSRPMPRLFRRQSPSKLSRQMISERNKLLFSPHRQSSRLQQAAKPLTKLRTPSPSKKSKIVRLILSGNDHEIATKIQSYLRMYLAKKQLEQRKQQICAIQAIIRGYLVRKDLKKKNQAAVVIQSIWRKYSSRKEYLCMKHAAIIIQKSYRIYSSRRGVERANLAALTIQKHYKGLLARREFKKRKEFNLSIIRLQSNLRRYLALKNVERKRAAIVCIQTHWRGAIARRELIRLRRINSSVVKLQSNIRRYLARKKFERQLSAIKCIQTHWRAVLARREAAHLRKVRDSVVKIQSVIRGHFERKKFKRITAAIIILQKHWRATCARRELDRLRRLTRSVIWIQSGSRGYLVRKQFKKSVEAIFKIQLQSFRNSLPMAQTS